MIVVAEHTPDPAGEDEAIRTALREELKQTLGITPRVTVEPFGTLDRPELKADRVTDTRPTND